MIGPVQVNAPSGSFQAAQHNLGLVHRLGSVRGKGLHGPQPRGRVHGSVQAGKENFLLDQVGLDDIQKGRPLGVDDAWQ